MRIFASVLCLCMVSFLQAQSVETRDLEMFSGVQVSEGIEVILTKSSINEATISSQKIELDRIITEVRGSTLYIEIEKNNSWNMQSTGRIKIELLHKSELDELGASSASSIVSNNRFQGEKLDLDVSSAGKIEIPFAQVEQLTIDASSAGKVSVDNCKAEVARMSVSSAGKIELKDGQVQKGYAEASSSGKVDASSVQFEKVNADASSGGKIMLGVISSEIKGEASSGGKVRYGGNPSRNCSASSGGKFVNQ